MANSENLREPWKPGESGNPQGKQRGTKNFTTLVREALKKIAEYKDEDGNPMKDTYENLLIRRVLNKAIQKGDVRMIEILWNYLDGKPRGSIDLGVDKESLGELTEFFRAMAEIKKP